MKVLHFLFLSFLGFLCHYAAWVLGWWPFQVIDCIYLFLMALGTGSQDTYKQVAPNITPLYWFLNLVTIPFYCWCFFGEGHYGKFFGSVYLMVTAVAFISLARYQIQHRKTLN